MSEHRTIETGVIDPKKSCRVCGWSGPLGVEHKCETLTSNPKVYCPFPRGEEPKGWPHEYVSLLDYARVIAELANYQRISERWLPQELMKVEAERDRLTATVEELRTVSAGLLALLDMARDCLPDGGDYEIRALAAKEIDSALAGNNRATSQQVAGAAGE